MDKLDRLIVSALTEDGRRPYREIARRLIRITAIGNLNKMGFGVAMALIKVRPGTVEACAAALAEYHSIRFVAILFGAADIAIQTLHTTLEELHVFVRSTLPNDIPDIISIEAYPEVRTIKSSWNWSSWFDLLQDKPE